MRGAGMLLLKVLCKQEHQLVDLRLVKKLANGQHQIFILTYHQKCFSLLGSMDENFEILALIQLERIGSELPVPFLLMNYDSFYSKLLGFLDDCKDCGILSNGEITSLWKVCDGNSEALAYLAGLGSLAKKKKNPPSSRLGSLFWRTNF
ncbi:hypothetical protein L3X38_024111 [Prunus dulcis]|uniref:Cytokinin riboside 5'-monophosphate phosphoribohydrolase n=1 Tax=Prunus dulcis TaxID=3755 RepID=A0AAD4VZB5_PRUDU|nr:hypothetical protein L3X38_024111 [Prunus dulcis]